MHGFDFLVPQFITRIQDIHIAVTPQIFADVLRVPKVEFPEHSSCEHLRTVSKEKLKSAFCEHLFEWGECQFTYCSGFAKGPWFLNMVMTFVLHPLSHYNFITKSHAQFLLSLFEHLTIDFPSHFILSILDVYRETTSRDKLIFSSIIMRILRHFSVPFLASDYFSYMCAIDAATVKRREAQFRSRQSGLAAPPSRLIPSRFAPSTSAPSFSTGDVTLGDIITQFQRMDTWLDTFSTELYQVNICVSRIA